MVLFVLVSVLLRCRCLEIVIQHLGITDGCDCAVFECGRIVIKLSCWIVLDG